MVVSNSFKSSYFKSFDDLLSDEEILENIYAFIKDHKEYDYIELEIALTKYVCSNPFERVYKRYYNTIVKYINYLTSKSIS